MSPTTKISGWPGTAEIGSDAYPPGAIRRRVQPFARRRRRDTRGPDHGLARDALAADDDTVIVDPVGALSQSHLDAEPLEARLRRARQILREAAEHALRHVDQHDAHRGGIDAPELRAQCRAHEHRDRAGHLHAGGPGADQHEREQIAMQRGIFLGLGLLERLENPVADADGVGEGLQPRREPLELVVPEVAVPHAGREDQVVVRDRHAAAGRPYRRGRERWAVSTPVTSPRITVAFRCLRSTPRIGTAIWPGIRAEVATW